MRISELHLLAFGPFTDRILHFSQDGFHLVYGPNEGGKSSALRAIDALLFGFPLRTADNFLHPYGDLQVGAKLVNQDGREISFARRKRQRKSIVRLDASGAAQPEHALEDFLKGLQQETFQRLYCINHDEFRAGGVRMRELKGLLGESLFAASLGGAGLSDVLESLEQEAAELFGKRSSRIKTEKAAYHEQWKHKKELEVYGKKWQSLKDEFDVVVARKAEIVERQTQLDASKRRLERTRNALPKIAEWKALRDELAGHEAFVLPSSYSIELRGNCEAALAQTRKRIAELSEKLHADDDQETHSDQSSMLIHHAATIDALQQRVGAQLRAIEIKAQEERKLQIAQSSASQLLIELGAEAELDHVFPRVRREHRAAIDDLATDEKRLRGRTRDLATKKAELEYELGAIDDTLSSTTLPVDTTKLSSVMHQVLRRGPLEQEIENARARLQSLTRHAARELSLLPYWSGSLEQLVRTKAPLRETVDQFIDEFARLDRDLQALTQRRSEKHVELEATVHAIAEVNRIGGVVTEADLEQARARRDHVWKLVQQAWLDDDQQPANARDAVPRRERCAEYESLVHETDALADRLRREADRVAELTVQQKKQAILKSSLEQLTSELARRASEHASLREQWLQTWFAAGVTTPGTPREMAAWLSLRETLLHQAAELEECRHEIEQLDAMIHASRCSVLAAMDEVEAQHGLGAESLERICEAATQLIERHKSLNTQRQQLLKDRARVAAQFSSLEGEQAQELAALEQWQASWVKAMSRIDSSPETTAAQAQERVRCLDDLAMAQRDASRLREAIQAIDAESARFADDVAALVKHAAPELAELPVVEAAKELKTRLDGERRTRQMAEHRDEVRQQRQAELAELQANADELELQLAQLCHLAGVPSREGLAVVERVSRAAERLRSVEDELRLISASASLADFVAAAEQADAAELDAQIAQLEQEIAEENGRRDEIVSRLTEISNAMSEIDGNDAAARADQRAMSHLARVHADAGRFVRLKIAASILRRQIERYREENKDPLLAKASEFFARMTCDEFAGLEAEYDDHGKPIIVGVRRNKERVDVAAMSDGTLDPLFLSLRLAYLQRRLSQYEPMPFIVDDILIHLDDERALATLHVLAELAQQTQVLFFTHHQRLKELAESHLAPDQVTVHQLERRDSSMPVSIR